MKLSIITATYNCENLLKDCLDSVASQDCIANIEHIIVDGRSTDNTVALAASYPHVSLIHSAKDRGIYHAFNTGVSLATGDIIYFLGADDSIYGKTSIVEVMQEFESLDIDYVMTRVKCFNEEVGEAWTTDTDLIEANGLCHPGFFCKKAVFDAIGPFSECFSLCADSYFMKEAVRRFKGKALNVISANFRQEGASAKSANRELLKRELSAVSLLLGENFESQEIQLDKNVLALKELLHKSLRLNQSFMRYKSHKIGVFGTRQLSITIAELLEKSGAVVVCFIVSDLKAMTMINDKPVASIEQASQMSLDFIVNCIEGTHEYCIADTLKQQSSNSKVISWRNL